MKQRPASPCSKQTKTLRREDPEEHREARKHRGEHDRVSRQLRKYKTRVIDRKTRNGEKTVDASPIPVSEGELDLDGLMSELSDDEVVRVKEIEFAPLTEEEALVQIDLLGHDFFAYTDRDTNLVNVLYRRDNGGYGLLKQKE